MEGRGFKLKMSREIPIKVGSAVYVVAQVCNGTNLYQSNKTSYLSLHRIIGLLRIL